MTTPAEDEIIALAAAALSGLGPTGGLGIGDDAAAVPPPRGRLLLTTDMLVEGVHFERAWTAAADLGWKALAVSLSDIAAMGGDPRHGLVSLGLPGDLDGEWVAGFYRGLAELAGAAGVAIVGGDTVASPGGIVVNVALAGEAEVPMTRDRSGPGDLLFVTGPLGGGAAGLWACQAGPETAEVFPSAVRQLLRPAPHLAAGRALRPWAERISLMDDSDGLVRSLQLLARASGAGTLVDLGSLPLHADAAEAALVAGEDADGWALYGGDDYVLVGAAPASEREDMVKAFAGAGLALAFIGELSERPGTWVRDRNGKDAPADSRLVYRHFPPQD